MRGYEMRVIERIPNYQRHKNELENRNKKLNTQSWFYDWIHKMLAYSLSTQQNTNTNKPLMLLKYARTQRREKNVE